MQDIFTPISHTDADSIDMVAVYRQIMRIVACLESSPYTDENKRQTDEVELDDLADPASELDTPQGLDAL